MKVIGLKYYEGTREIEFSIVGKGDVGHADYVMSKTPEKYKKTMARFLSYILESRGFTVPSIYSGEFCVWFKNVEVMSGT